MLCNIDRCCFDMLIQQRFFVVGQLFTSQHCFLLVTAIQGDLCGEVGRICRVGQILWSRSCWRCRARVSFSVKCADTRVGLHVRVVGSVPSLGGWDPHKGLVLNTSASDFPNWKQTEPTPLEEGNVVEYKYVICDNSGSGVRWEERTNRSVHIADLVEREMVPPNGWIAITENFLAYDCDEIRFRLARTGGLDRVRSSSSETSIKARQSDHARAQWWLCRWARPKHYIESSYGRTYSRGIPEQSFKNDNEMM